MNILQVELKEEKSIKKLFTLLAILVLGFSLTGCKHKHELVQHEAKQATCTEDGHYAYEECTECDYTTYVKIEALGHKDEDFDHNCDNNCEEVIGEHVDSNNDHNCDYGCSETFGEHVDTNDDHKCEYGCEEAIGEHVDTNNDHNCDYGCEEVIGEHVDSNNDHNCDYGCSETFGEHVDTNDDHNCDYCSGTMTECSDKNHDFICDICDTKIEFTFDEKSSTCYVDNVEDLYRWANDYTVYNLELSANIYLPNELIFDNDNDGVNDSNWAPVIVYEGITVNGNGFSIVGLQINNPSHTGFSSAIYEQGCVKNLNLEDVSINGRRTGAVTANNYGTIINCSISGEIGSTDNNLGGIAGYNCGEIIACVNYANIISDFNYIGGFVGQMNGGKIIACYNFGNVSGSDSVGGIVGSFFSGDIISCYNLDQVTGTHNYGYIAGYGAGTFNSNYWIDLDGDNASTANGFNETQEGCTLIDETTTWEVAKVAMNEAIAAYNETATTKCEYVYELNSDEDTEPLVLVLQEEQEDDTVARE